MGKSGKFERAHVGGIGGLLCKYPSVWRTSVSVFMQIAHITAVIFARNGLYTAVNSL